MSVCIGSLHSRNSNLDSRRSWVDATDIISS